MTTVCPCSKAISRGGAHGQRALVRLAVRMTRFEWLEEFIDIAERSGSAQVCSLLKGKMKNLWTEQAYDDACFVEDVVRRVADNMKAHPHVSWFRVEVESFESIHCHNAFAVIERDCSAGQGNASREKRPALRPLLSVLTFLCLLGLSACSAHDGGTRTGYQRLRLLGKQRQLGKIGATCAPAKDPQGLPPPSGSSFPDQTSGREISGSSASKGRLLCLPDILQESSACRTLRAETAVSAQRFSKKTHC